MRVTPVQPSRTQLVDSAHVMAPQVESPSNPELHDCNQVRMEPPYPAERIDAYLSAKGIRRPTQSTEEKTAFGNCLFQSVLFCDFFEGVESGRIQPGTQEYAEPARYLLKKQLETVQAMKTHVTAACDRYDAMCTGGTPEVRKALASDHPNAREAATWARNLRSLLGKMESELLRAVADAGNHRPTREKAFFFIIVHAMMRDAAKGLDGWLTALEKDPSDPRLPHTLLPRGPAQEGEGYTRNLMLSGHLADDLFSPDPVSEKTKEAFEDCFPKRSNIKLIPSFASNGSTGVQSELHAIVQGQHVITAALDEPFAVHDNDYQQGHLATILHDLYHLDMLLPPATAKRFQPVFAKITSADGGDLQAAKQDMVVLHSILHERPHRVGNQDSFETLMDEMAKTDAGDLQLLMEEAGASPDYKNAGDWGMRKFGLRKALGGLWKNFKERHQGDFGADGPPNFMKKW